MKQIKIESVKVALSIRVLVGFLLAVVLISLLGVYLRKRALEFQQYREQVAHSRIEVDALQSYLSAVEDAETSQRGFLLTENEKYLAPYDAAKTGITYRVNQLVDLGKDDAENVKATEQLKALTAAKFTELALTIQKRRESGLAAALAVVNTDEGNDEMAAIRKIVAEIDQRVRRRQALSEDNYNASVYRTELSFTAALVVQMILLLILSFTCRVI